MQPMIDEEPSPGIDQLITTLLPTRVVVGAGGQLGTYAARITTVLETTEYPTEFLASTLNW